MAYTWVAVYRDGTTYRQICPETGADRSSEAIDRRQLECLCLYGHGGELVLTQHYEPGQRPIYRRRREYSPGLGIDVVCHLVGWQQTIAGQNVQHIAYVFENDGRIIMAGRWQASHPWFYPIVPVEAEKIEVAADDRPEFVLEGAEER